MPKINVIWTSITILAIILIIFFAHTLIQASIQNSLQPSSPENGYSVTPAIPSEDKQNLSSENSNPPSTTNANPDQIDDVFGDLNQESDFLDNFSDEFDN